MILHNELFMFLAFLPFLIDRLIDLLVSSIVLTGH